MEHPGILYIACIKAIWFIISSYVVVCFFFFLFMPLSFCVCSLFSGTTNSCCTSMYEKTFPIKVVQSPTHSTSSGRSHRVPHRCTAQEVRHEDIKMGSRLHISCCLCWLWISPPAFIQSIREEEKEIYRQLLTMVSGGQSSFVHNGSSHAIVRSHRDLYVYLNPTSRNFILSLLEVVYKNNCRLNLSLHIQGQKN